MRHWLALAVLALALTVGLSKADGQKISSGLNVVGYSITDVPPLRSDTEYQQCGVGWYEQINYTWDYEENLFADCGWDLFMLHYTGFIVIPNGVESVRFGIASDDGSDVTIDGVNFGGWYDKGCSMDYSDRVVLPTNEPLKLDAWMYENGGGTCLMLFWQFNGDDQDWSIVPESAFSNEAITPTTTSSSSTTTTTSTTTTSSTTLAPTTTTTLPPTTTTVRPTTTTSTSTTSTSTTSTTQEPTTTTTSVPPTTTTLKTQDGRIQTDTTTSLPVGGTSTTTIQPTTTTTQVETTTTTIPAVPPEISAVEAVALATDAKVLETVTPDEAKAIFTAVDENHLTDAQGAAIVEAVQNAPTSVRKAFEGAINVFGGHTDQYKPIGSVITVRQRRVMIVAGLTLLAVPAVPPRRRKNA
jgi:hypothetical protein